MHRRVAESYKKTWLWLGSIDDNRMKELLFLGLTEWKHSFTCFFWRYHMDFIKICNWKKKHWQRQFFKSFIFCVVYIHTGSWLEWQKQKLKTLLCSITDGQAQHFQPLPKLLPIHFLSVSDLINQPIVLAPSKVPTTVPTFHQNVPFSAPITTTGRKKNVMTKKIPIT